MWFSTVNSVINLHLFAYTPYLHLRKGTLLSRVYFGKEEYPLSIITIVSFFFFFRTSLITRVLSVQFIRLNYLLSFNEFIEIKIFEGILSRIGDIRKDSPFVNKKSVLMLHLIILTLLRALSRTLTSWISRLENRRKTSLTKSLERGIFVSFFVERFGKDSKSDEVCPRDAKKINGDLVRKYQQRVPLLLKWLVENILVRDSSYS